MKASEVFREARNVLFERGWHQGGYEGPDGSVCVVGAMRTAATGSPRLSPDDVLAQQIRDTADTALPFGRRCSIWNDHSSTTFDEVIERLELGEKHALIAEEG